MRESTETTNTFGVCYSQSGVLAASHACDSNVVAERPISCFDLQQSEQSMAASNIHTNVLHPPPIVTYNKAPVIHSPAQSMEASASEVHDPLQSIESSSAAEVETVAQSLKRLECLIEANTERQNVQFIEIKRTLLANGDLAQQSIVLAHRSLKRAEDAIKLAEDIKNDTRGLGEMDASNKTLLARLKDLLLGVRLPTLTTTEP
ncbi:uncharacterized protein F5147DRAFT_657360 [Suillus discolor]|uniref:Uncharacterized protein n=1 Tax=Suillus discolor TaxID=1912936 RepID=A0A9P7EXJ2_9AGAM|nr:uncharacterized protein F5147DRAFT_657360 [Suillus discolor]KAG2093741.1 hypothetical protein F5147DRAFT_657360 [Suillus discolor]